MLKKLFQLGSVFVPLIAACVLTGHLRAQEAPAASPRQLIANAVSAATPDEQKDLILAMRSTPSPEIVEWLEKWKGGEIYVHTTDDGAVITALLLTGQPNADGASNAVKLVDDTPFTGADGQPILINPDEVPAAETTSGIRRAMKEVSDLAALADPDPVRRLRAVKDSAIGQNPEKLPGLQLLEKSEKEPAIRRALRESISLIQLKSTVPAEKIAACKTLGDLHSLAAQDALKAVLKEAGAADDKGLAAAAQSAISSIDGHISRINAMGTAFRGLSLGSVLLVVAIGLAITFGLMGVINMAHGEFIAVGAYTTYVIQNVFAAGLKLSPFGFSLSIPGFNVGGGDNTYFILAIPASFLVAALVGILLERSVIQFLYKRPLESLLATWGISLVMQQILKFVFGSNNVQVNSPAWLSGNWTVNDVIFGWNRLFVIGFAVLIIAGTWLVLNKTSLGLLIRAVMQNRNMAACMGVRTERVNTMTFAFGCGLAGLAGAFLSQIGNVGPTMGQLYIVDSFMTVVVGGVGNIVGTVISALGIGVADQTFQQYLGNPVIGKILVLGAIILFLQWRPAGLFVTRSRSLD
ncbi:urea ABC transporter permease subunit UrtB [Luteolibacter sp. SL250]|uniref:urea ABC transporter permease subunit UrtB n=1 Tax=Luteolibacter sp. SL250 TaxID=2995170 RepID=UPI0022717D2B|nr:urea ABC transporter permease subunit UrtB [Luteolibacter sp. SL250]WAC20315.1 urea ABC transporter permease subunit UrtB [Luteolibacter sp. SL250]